MENIYTSFVMVTASDCLLKIHLHLYCKSVYKITLKEDHIIYKKLPAYLYFSCMSSDSDLFRKITQNPWSDDLASRPAVY